ncbi:hypothetical protein pb186bvf_004753 [Paramecium bursaria]
MILRINITIVTLRTFFVLCTNLFIPNKLSKNFIKTIQINDDKNYK